MSKTAEVRAPRRKGSRPTMRSLEQRIDQLQARLEDLEDLRALEKAIADNGTRPMIPWAQAKKQLGLD